jgi:CubicO group peptidase (beta-lactamase class C family)
MNVVLGSGNPRDVGMSDRRVRYVADLAAGWVDQGITPALVILVARRGVVVLHEAYGHLTPEPDSPPLELNTLFPLVSLTKPITATAAMILVEDGLLGLNRPVQWYIPEFVGEGKDAVMVHHLLTHTSGLRDEDLRTSELDAFAEKRADLPPPEETEHPFVHEWLWLRYDEPLWKPPGTEMSYCNYGYELLGEIVRRISGRSLADFCQERIFQPLGMGDTYCVVPDSVKDKIIGRPKGDSLADGIVTWKMLETDWACVGAFSTAMDVAIFGQMFLDRGTYGDARILSPASVAEMTRDQIPGIGSRWEGEFFPEASWGLGWSVRGNKKSKNYGTLHSARSFAHGGAGGVYLWVDPVYEIVGAYFSVMLEEEKYYVDLFENAVTAAVVDV